MQGSGTRQPMVFYDYFGIRKKAKSPVMEEGATQFK